jgi:hypothetical protein
VSMRSQRINKPPRHGDTEGSLASDPADDTEPA